MSPRCSAIRNSTEQTPALEVYDRGKLVSLFSFQRDGERYVVFNRATGDRVGFVQHTGEGRKGRWHWTDTYMAHSGHRATRDDAAVAALRSCQKVA